MAKHIVVCSDGTGNTAIKGRGTNVFKLFEAVDLSGHRFDSSLTPQVAVYDDGVGTQNLKLVRIASGAFGFGLARNVKQLYTEIVRLYDPPDPEKPNEPGDALYLFGFSRGAFTVRTLVGLIATCGLLDAKKLETAGALTETVDKAYAAYRKCYQRLARMRGREPDRSAGQAFKAEYGSHDKVPIAFLGVWDTVDAVGLPFWGSDVLNAVVYPFKFPDNKLSASVGRARHALAIDDERKSFHPQIWDEDSAEAKMRIRQVWFAGAHSNVGGGYPKQGMSLVALDWMLSEAEGAGLRLNPSDREYYQEHANFDDKLYDPRSGLGVFYRWKIRDIETMCRKRHIASPNIHLSVFERIAHGVDGYAPGNLPRGADVVYTRPFATDRVKVENAEPMLSARAKAVKSVYSGTHPRLLDRVGPAIVAGQISYWLLVISCAAIVWTVSGAPAPTTGRNVWLAVQALGRLIGRIISSPGQTAFDILRVVFLEHPLLIAAVGTALLVDYFADRWISAEFSGFWHGTQQALRKALKDATVEVRKARRPQQPLQQP